MSTLYATPETSEEVIENSFRILKENQFTVASSSLKDRLTKLKNLNKSILKHRKEIQNALQKDFKKHASETDLIEIFSVTSEIKHTRRNLYRWINKQRVGTPITLLGSSSYVKHEAKGVVLIIAPWNFPINLTLGPLVNAVAAGNTVIIKPSEFTPHTNEVLTKIIQDVFKENEVKVIQGGVPTSTKLLSLPFNHIFFTGSPSVGKIVMEAAAKNLCSVTLELGGKSPVIIDSTANIDKAAKRVAWIKHLNNGQICIAPDYVLVEKSVEDQFIEKVEKHLSAFYGDNPEIEPSYCRIINASNFSRVRGLIDDAVSKGATIRAKGESDPQEKYIPPTLLTNIPHGTRIMDEEIFGPVLPIFTFNKLSEAIEIVNEREKPLALYIFSKSKKNIDYIHSNTRAGGGCVNHVGIHFFNNELPFGGINNSGMGKAHGWYSFQAFSNARGILHQKLPSFLEVVAPPYTNFKAKLVDFTIRWL
ncbi:MAG: aldehyde dehydrogenase family protein [Crocinitomicaceae bacterium]